MYVNLYMIVNLQRTTTEKNIVRSESVVTGIGGWAAMHNVYSSMGFGCSDHGDVNLYNGWKTKHVRNPEIQIL